MSAMGALMLVLFMVFLIAGCSQKFNLDYQPDNDIVIVKLAPNATMEWSKVIDSGGDDHVHSIIQTPDNNYVIVASSQPGRHPGTYGLMKFSPDKILWNVSFLKTDVSVLETKCSTPVILARNGDLIAGDLCRINPDGIVLWNRTVPVNGYVQSIIETDDGGYIVGGGRYDPYEAGSKIQYDDNGNITGQRSEENWTAAHNLAEQTMIAKIDPSGNVTWQTSLGNMGFKDPVWLIIDLHNDQGYVAQTKKDAIRLDKDGHYVSVQHLNYEVPETDNGTINGKPLTDYVSYSPGLVFYNQSGMAIAKLKLNNASTSTSRTSDGGYISAGLADTSHNKAIDGNLRVIKLRTDGTKEWDRNISGVLVTGVNQIIQTSDGGYVLAGEYDKEWG